MSYARLIFSTILTAFIFASAACQVATGTEFLVVNGAYDIQNFTSHEGNRKQVTYKVNIQYPGFAIKKDDYERLKDGRWKQCGTDAETWDYFRDASNDTPKGVHQYVTYWTKDRLLLTIAMRYYSTLADLEANLKEPNNSMQHVVLLFDAYENPKEVQERLQITCN